MTIALKAYDVLAVLGHEAESVHVEEHGRVPNGTRTDRELGLPVVIIGGVEAADAEAAHTAALALIDEAA